MESLMKPVTENGDCTARRSLRGTVPIFSDLDRVLDEIRAGAENALYGAGSGKSEELFAKHVVSLVEGAGLPVLQVMHYRWFLRELARLWRTRKGRDLAFHLELCIRKWVGLGLEPRTLQFLVCEAHSRLKGKFEGRSPNDGCRTQSVESVDVRSGPGPDTGILDSSNPGIPSRDSSTPGPLPEHSIPRSLGPSVPEELP
jgi:hypothetical protein